MTVASPPINYAHSDSGGRTSADGIQPDLTGSSERSLETNFGTNNTQEKALQNLEAKKDTGSNIHWHGSSYTGVDIQAVAHLYGSTAEGTNPREDAVLHRIAFNEALQQGADRLSSQVDSLATIPFADFDAKGKAFNDATGLNGGGTPDQQALRLLRTQFLTNGNFGTFIGRSKIKEGLTKVSEAAKRTYESDRSSLEREAEIRTQSSSTITLGNLQTISLQSHREKYGVRALGHSYVKGYTRGPRTIAGSMIFTVFSEHPLKKLLLAMGTEGIWKDPQISTLIPDQIPPIDITISFANEYGALSRLTVYGVEFLNDGTTFSIDDLLTEQVMNFVARDIDVMTKAGQIRLTKLQRGMTEDKDDSATSLLFGNENYEAYLDSLKVRRSLVNR